MRMNVLSAMKRRSVLTTVVGGLSGFSGCLGTNSATNPPQTPNGVQSLEWTGEIVEKNTESHPPKVRLALLNKGKQPLKIGFGPTPPFSDPDGTNDDEQALILFHPEMGPHEAPDTPIDGCWKLEPEETVAINSILVERTLGENDEVAETYLLYNAAENTACFPDGEYTFKDAILILDGEDRQEWLLILRITIKNGQINTLTTEGPNSTA